MLVRSDKFQKADRVTQRAMQQWPDLTRRHCMLGVFSFNLNRLEDAAVAFRQAITLDAA